MKIFIKLFFIFSIIFSYSCYSEQIISKDNIPKDIPSDVRKNIEELFSKYPDSRAKAARKLKEFGENAIPAIPFLIGLLDDVSPLVLVVNINYSSSGMEIPTSPGNQAAETLISLNDKNSIESLISVLKGKNEISQKKAAFVLGNMQHPAVVDPLLVCLKDENQNVKKYAALALEIRDEGLRLETIRNLIEKNDIADVEYMILAALNDKSWEIRSEAINFLGSIKDPRAVEPLISVLGDKSLRGDGAWVIGAAVKALGEIGDKRAVEALIVVLEDALSSIKTHARKEAAMALGQIKDKRAVEPLIKCLKDDSWLVKEYAARALGEIKDERAVDFLIENLHDESHNVRSDAAEALGEIKDMRAIDPLIKMLNDKSNNVKSDAANALGKIKDKRAVESLVRSLNDPSDMVKMSAVEALGEIKDMRAVDPIISCMKNEPDHNKMSIADALCKITGMEYFGCDPLKWESWWEENKNNIMSINNK